MMSKKDRQEKFYSVTYEELIPKEHFLRKLDLLIDFDFVYVMVRFVKKIIYA